MEDKTYIKIGLKSIFSLILLTFTNYYASIAQDEEMPIDSLNTTITSISLKETWEEESAEILELLENKDELIKDLYQSSMRQSYSIQRLLIELKAKEILELIEKFGVQHQIRAPLSDNKDISIDTLPNGNAKKIRFFVTHAEIPSVTAPAGVYPVMFVEPNNNVGGELRTLIKENDTYFKKRYPITILLLKTNIIEFITVVNETRSDPNQVMSVSFPPLIVSASSVNDKRKLADRYISFIQEITRRPAFRRYSFNTYDQLEKREVPDGDIDKLLRLRVAFIKVLKKEYEKTK